MKERKGVKCYDMFMTKERVWDGRRVDDVGKFTRMCRLFREKN